MAELQPGTEVWTVHPQSKEWVSATVVSCTADTATVKLLEDGTTLDVPLEDCPHKNPHIEGGRDDLTQLDYLNEPGLLENLKVRYEIDGIYTYSGTILIAINPFQRLPLYGDEIADKYTKAEHAAELPPHLYGIASDAYKSMVSSRKSQAILVSGESGAGKTESTKVVMNYLAHVGRQDTLMLEEGETSVEQQVLESNPLLEAFGNAKTVRNDNSSRFGKFMDLQFDATGRISGAEIKTYLLERSRVVQVANVERNYHIFYQVAHSATGRNEFELGDDARAYHYLNQSENDTIDGLDDAKEFEVTSHAMSVVGIRDEDKHNAFKLVAAILHVGNISFAEDGEGSKILDDVADGYLGKAAKQLDVDKGSLWKALSTRKITTVGEVIEKPLSPKAASESRDTFTKALYSRLFDWLVAKCNLSIGQDEFSFQSIGILDIYGFESFKINSFEQLCINLTNEKLQQHFNRHVFKTEQAEYVKEEIDWSYIEFTDNQDALDLIEQSPFGIIPLLDEQCRLPKGSAENYVDGMKTRHKSHERFDIVKTNQLAFKFTHYAGPVVYDTSTFLEKNKDFTIAEHSLIMQSSSNAFMSNLYPAEKQQEQASSGPGGKKKSGFTFKSLGSTFCQQLDGLMQALSSCEPHYIRCIKPNPENKPRRFNSPYILDQLRCGGVLEAVRVTQAGFPTRKPYSEFVDRFRLIVTKSAAPKSNEDPIALTREIITKLDLERCQLGKTKVFLRAGQMALLDGERAKMLSSKATLIQAAVRGWFARKEYYRLRRAALVLQSHWRGRNARLLARSMREQRAATIICREWRRHTAESTFRKLRYAAIRIQSAERGRIARAEARCLREHQKATVIQAFWRMAFVRGGYNVQRRAAVSFQCAWRKRKAILELRELRRQAKDVANLESANQSLLHKLNEWKSHCEASEMKRVELQTKLVEAEKRIVTLETSSATPEALNAAEEEAAKQKELVAAEAKRATCAEEALEELKQTNKDLEAKVAELQAAAAAAATASVAATTAAALAHSKESNVSIESLSGYSQTSPEISPEVFEQLHEELAYYKALAEESQRATEGSSGAPVAAAANGGSVTASVLSSISTGQSNNASDDIKEIDHPLKASDGDAVPREEVDRLKSLLFNTQKNVIDLAEKCNKLEVALHEERSARERLESGAADESPKKGSARATTSPRTPDLTREELRARKAAEKAEKAAQDAANMVRLAEERQTYEQVILARVFNGKLGFAKAHPSGPDRPVAACLIFRFMRKYDCLVADTDSNAQFLTALLEGFRATTPRSNGADVPGDEARDVEIDADEFALQCKEKAERVSNVLLLIALIHPVIHSEAAEQTQKRRWWRRSTVEAPKPPTGAAILFYKKLIQVVEDLHMDLQRYAIDYVEEVFPRCCYKPQGAPTSPSKKDKNSNNPWSVLLGRLSDTFNIMKDQKVSRAMVRIIFEQLFQVMDVRLTNTLLQEKKCCSFSNAEYMVLGMNSLEQWLMMNGTDWFGRSFERLAHIRQAITFLVVSGKHRKSLPEFINGIVPGICPNLSLPQVFRLASQYVDDKYGSPPISPEVLAGIQGILRRQQHKLPEEERAKGLSYKLELESMPPGLDIVQIVHQGGARDGVTAIEAEACSDAIWGEIVVQAQ